MPQRIRTTKKLAKRIDLQYFKGRHPFRSWRLWLSVLVPVAAVVWFVSARASGQKVYSSGPLSASHAAFGRKCEVCHVTENGKFRTQVSDAACLSCHDAPAHHPQQVAFTPACGSCHVEHRGPVRLAHTADSSCAQCHSVLHIKTGELKYVRNVDDFDNHHPEFALWRLNQSDPGNIKLNHYAHLRPKLASPNGPVQLTCHDCHRVTGAEGTWPYAAQTKTAATPTAIPANSSMLENASVAPTSAAPSAISDETRTSHPRAYMSPILYATQCAACHVKDLQFDKRFDEPAPHDKPEVVQAFLVKKYTDYFAAHPNALSEPLPVRRILRSPWPPMPPPPHTREEWIAWQVAFADRLLFDKGCKLCHTMLYGEPLPKVAKSSIPVRWLDHAAFDHDAHRFLSCTGCHAAAPQSRQTADILLPRIKSCRDCHQEAGAKHDAADGRCSECHAYHEWRKEMPPQDTFTVLQLRGRAAGTQ